MLSLDTEHELYALSEEEWLELEPALGSYTVLAQESVTSNVRRCRVVASCAFLATGILIAPHHRGPYRRALRPACPPALDGVSPVCG